MYRVTVGGEVRQPNTYTLRREHTIAQAVAQAGGITENGMLDRVELTRAGQVHVINLTDPTDLWAQTAIRSGDAIMVFRERNLLREYITPAASVVSVLVSLLNILTR
jgi:protein involved in polysaccharide export with SLBB domain